MKLRLNENLEPKCQRRKFKCKVMLPSKIMSIIKGSQRCMAYRINFELNFFISFLNFLNGFAA